MQTDYHNLKEAGRIARNVYLSKKSVSTCNYEIDSVLEGGIESGNFYLFLGSAKNGKSTILRCIGMQLSKNFPILYVNFEQTAANVYGKIYSLVYGRDFRSHIHSDPEAADANIEKLPNDPFYIAFWPDKLGNKAFNMDVKGMLKANIEQIEEEDPEHRKPVIIIENLSDIYNERIGSRDNLVNVVTQTAQDIKNFAISEDVAIFLAHHTGKISGSEPMLDDVRDSKRVVDLAHSIFCAYVEVEPTVMGGQHYNYFLKYVAGRGASEPKRWKVEVTGIDMQLLTQLAAPVKNERSRRGKKGI